jgi:hypothetical protein
MNQDWCWISLWKHFVNHCRPYNFSKIEREIFSWSQEKPQVRPCLAAHDNDDGIIGWWVLSKKLQIWIDENNIEAEIRIGKSGLEIGMDPESATLFSLTWRNGL